MTQEQAQIQFLEFLSTKSDATRLLEFSFDIGVKFYLHPLIERHGPPDVYLGDYMWRGHAAVEAWVRVGSLKLPYTLTVGEAKKLLI